MAVEWTNETQARLNVGGKALEYACWGPVPSAAPTIVMLHEGLGSVGLWRDLPERLAAVTGYGVVAYSRAGYGASDPVSLPRPLNYITDEAVKGLGPVMDQLGIEHAVLLGHSDGATQAAIYAGSVSDMRVRGLILIAPHFFAEPAGVASIKKAGEAFESGALREKLARHHSHVDVAFMGWHDVWTDPEFMNWNVADAIDHLRIPVLAIQGRDDPYGSLAQISEIEDRIYSPLDTLILEGCEHAPHFEKPTETMDAIAEFCARLQRIEQEEVAIA